MPDQPDQSDQTDQTGETGPPAPPPAALPEPAEPAAPAPPPRAFAQGTGVLLQIVGMTLFLSTCCVCSSLEAWDPPMSKDEAKEKVEQQNEADFIITAQRMFQDPATAGLSLMVVCSTVGGLALAVFGLGLQSDKPRAAWAAMITAALWLVILIASGVCLWIGGATLIAKGWNIVMVLLACAVLAFTVAALRQILKHPPPPGLDILPPDFEIPKFRH